MSIIVTAIEVRGKKYVHIDVVVDGIAIRRLAQPSVVELREDKSDVIVTLRTFNGYAVSFALERCNLKGIALDEFEFMSVTARGLDGIAVLSGRKVGDRLWRLDVVKYLE